MILLRRAWAQLVWIIVAAAALLPDILGLLGFAVVARGVYLVFGDGWALIFVGAPVCIAYVLRETGALRARRP